MTVVMPEQFGPCCPMAYVFQSTLDRARARGDEESKARAVRAVQDWAEHQIEGHDADAEAVPSCPACQRLELPPPDGVSPEEWAYAGRIHRITHRLIPIIIQPG